MPELPEVETIKLQLNKFLKGHKVVGVDAHYKNFEGNGKNLIGGKFLGARRFGKVVIVDLSNGYSFAIHVKLTGQLIYRGPNLKTGNLSSKVIGGVPGKHTHVIFELDKGGNLYYNDVRRFGWVKIIKTKDVSEIPFVKKLGPEPFGSAQGHGPKLLTVDIFREILSKTSRLIKIVIMDQEKMGGVGNIYANDALWLAKINPVKPAKQLDSKAAGQLYEAILSVLKEGIKYGGASELAFVTPDGTEGQYQRHTLAYGKTGEPCERCHKAKFVKTFLGGRGTYFCPVCQKS